VVNLKIVIKFLVPRFEPMVKIYCFEQEKIEKKISYWHYHNIINIVTVLIKLFHLRYIMSDIQNKKRSNEDISSNEDSDISMNETNDEDTGRMKKYKTNNKGKETEIEDNDDNNDTNSQISDPMDDVNDNRISIYKDELPSNTANISNNNLPSTSNTNSNNNSNTSHTSNHFNLVQLIPEATKIIKIYNQNKELLKNMYAIDPIANQNNSHLTISLIQLLLYLNWNIF